MLCSEPGLNPRPRQNETRTDPLCHVATMSTIGHLAYKITYGLAFQRGPLRIVSNQKELREI